MAVPKRKVSKSRRDMRSACKGIDPQPMNFCNQGACEGTPCLPHIVCKTCGFYKGKKVLKTKTDRAAQRNEVRAHAEEKAKTHAQPTENETHA